MPSAAKYAVVFILVMGITVAVPSFPPAIFFYQILGIQIAQDIGGVAVATILKSIVNGAFWMFIAAVALVASCPLKRAFAPRRRALNPIPTAPQLPTPMLEPMVADGYTSTIPPLVTVGMEKTTENLAPASTQAEAEASFGKDMQVEKPRARRRRRRKQSSKNNPCPHKIGYFNHPNKSRKIPSTCLTCEQLLSCSKRANKLLESVHGTV